MTTSRWSSSALLVCGLCVVLGLLLSPPALSKPSPAFKGHVEKALKLYEAGEYEDAIKEFQSAYALRQMPKLLLNIAQSHRKLGRAKEALGFYEFYLRVEPNPKPEIKTELEAYIKQTRAMLAAAEEMRRRQEDEEKLGKAQEQTMLSIGNSQTDEEKRKAEQDKAEKEKQEKEKALAEQALREKQEKAKAEQQAQIEKNLAQQEALRLRAEAQPKKQQQPIYKKWWFWTAVGGVAAVAVVGVVLGTTLSAGPAMAPDPMLPQGIDLRDQRF